eukprot:5851852-Pyramimonas_sp.AAC.1
MGADSGTASKRRSTDGQAPQVKPEERHMAAKKSLANYAIQVSTTESMLANIPGDPAWPFADSDDFLADVEQSLRAVKGCAAKNKLLAKT